MAETTMGAAQQGAVVGEAAGSLSGEAADIARALFGASPPDDLAAHDAASLKAAATLAADALARKGEGAEVDVDDVALLDLDLGSAVFNHRVHRGLPVGGVRGAGLSIGVGTAGRP